MRLLVLSVALLALAGATTTVVSEEQQCLEDFVGLTQGWFQVLKYQSLQGVDLLISESARWSRQCGEVDVERVASATENEKLRGLFACLRTIRSLPGKISKFAADLASGDNVQLAVDGYDLLQSLESLVLDCGL